MPTYTTTYSLGKPVVGADEDAWGDTLNTSLDAIDDILDGTTPVTGIDINSGTLDGVTIGGTTAGAGTFTTLTANTSITGTLATAAQPNVTSLGTLTSLTVSGDVSFGDNDKAIFGAGSDLQIYHDGSNSYISDQGTGNLRVLATNFNVKDATGTRDLFYAQDGGLTKIYYNGLDRIETTSTGIDVTGTVTADGLTVEKAGGSAALFKGYTSVTSVDSANNGEILLGNNSSYQGRISYEGNGGVLYIENSYSNNAADILFRARSSGTAQNKLLIEGTGDISFYEDTGTTAKFFWDASAERLGIGTSSPDNPLHVVYADSTAYSDATGDFGVQIENTDTTTNSFSQLHFRTGNSDSYIRSIREGDNLSSLAFLTDDGGTTGDVGEVMRLTSGGNVGIGTSSPDSLLEVEASAGARIRMTDTGTQSYTIGNTGTSFNIYNESQASEAMRIDSSGNLLVGKTSSNATVEGFEARSSGLIIGTVDSSYPLQLRRLTNDGEIIQFRKDSTTVGSIASRSGVVTSIILDPRSGGTGLTGGYQGVFPTSNTGAINDAHADLGGSSNRFRNLYLSGGVYLGGTGAANKLDDYEEGTWTPTASFYSGSMTVVSAEYTKIGHVVLIKARLTFDGTSDSDNVQIAGLPFSMSSTKRGGGFIIVDGSGSINSFSYATATSLYARNTAAALQTYNAIGANTIEFWFMYEAS